MVPSNDDIDCPKSLAKAPLDHVDLKMSLGDSFTLLEAIEQPDLHAQTCFGNRKDITAAGMHCVDWPLAVVGQPDGHRQWQYGQLKVVSIGKA